MKLNGWQRLWIVVSTIYLVVLALFVIANFPTPDKILHRDQFYDELPNESLSRLVRLSAGRGFLMNCSLRTCPHQDRLDVVMLMNCSAMSCPISCSLPITTNCALETMSPKMKKL